MSGKARPKPWVVWIGLGLLALVHALALLRSEPPSPSASDSPLEGFSADRAVAVLGRLLGDGAPHPLGSAAHARVRERVLGELARLGLAPEVHTWLTPGKNGVIGLVRDVIATLPSTSAGNTEVAGRSAKSVLLCAHYDSVAAGPGAGDDGAGVAALLEIARAELTRPERQHPLVLLIDDGEEVDLLGARAFVAQSPLAADVACVLNLEARGTSGRSNMFETSEPSGWLVERYAHAVEHPAATSIAYEIYKRMPNDTDLSVFKQAGLPGLNFAFIGGLARYHTPLDDLQHLDSGSVQHQGEQVLALVRALDAVDLASPSSTQAGRRVYTDVLGAFVLTWPESWSVGLAIVVALLAWLAARASVRANMRAGGRARRAEPLSIARSSFAALLGIVTAAIVALAITSALVLLRGRPDPWSAHPAATRAAVCLASFAAALAVARKVGGRKASADERAHGIWLLLAAAGVVTGLAAPSASYVLLLPSTVAALIALVLRRVTFVAIALPLVVAAMLWMPLLLGLELAFEFRQPIAIGAAVGILGVLFAPLAGLASGTARRAAKGLAAASAVAFVVAFAVPAHDAAHPSWVDFMHVEEAESGRARVFALSGGAPLDADVRAAGPFTTTGESASDAAAAQDGQDSRPVAWWPRGGTGPSVIVAPVETLAPVLELLGTTRAAGQRVVHARFASRRGATRLVLHLPDGVTLRSVTHGREHVTEGFPRQGIVIFVGLDGAGAESAGAVPGIELELAIDRDDKVRVDMLDSTAGLPPDCERLPRSRPVTCVPRGEGDQSIVVTHVDL